MIGAFVRHFIGTGASTSAYSALSQIIRDLEVLRRDESLVRVLEYWKANLYSQLRWSFDSAVAKALTLKTLNVLLARHHLRQCSTRVMSRPIGLVVDPSNVCRLACPGCVHSASAESKFYWPKATLQPDRFTALLQRYGPHAIGIYFCNYGEPLLNLRTPEYIRLAKTYLLQTSLSTSMSVQKFDADAYVASGLDYMVVSIDGATQQVYERFRRNGKLELALQNVRELVAAKRRAGKRTPVIAWHFLAFEHNAHEIPAASRMAADIGVDHFRVVEPFDVTWDDPKVRGARVDSQLKRFSWLSTLSIARNWNPFPSGVPDADFAAEFDRPWNASRASESPSTGSTCRWLYQNLVMDATGRVMPCCGAPGPAKDLVFAQFDAQADAFNSEKYRQARAYFAGRPAERPYCADCEWVDSPVNIGAKEIWTYFRSADAGYFNRRSLELLANW